MAERIGAVIRELIGQAQAAQAPLFAIQRQWRELVGPALAAHSKPVRLARGRLTVHVHQPGDAFAFNYRRRDILEALRREPAWQVSELVIRPGSL
ncbi:MAG TPA: DUF721 domain-containing protein [bacterium]